jgi:four helix bundle protein
VEGGGIKIKEKVMSLQSYKEPEVWQLAMDLAEHCYQVTKAFPKDVLFGMTSQIRRATASIPANIAEGQGRDHTKEFLNFLSMARGSLMEVETHLMLSKRVGLLTQEQLDPLLGLTDRISRMLTGLRKALHPLPFTLHASRRPRHCR